MLKQSSTQTFMNDVFFEGDVILDVTYLSDDQLGVKLIVLTDHDSNMPSRIETDTIYNEYNTLEDILNAYKNDEFEGEGSSEGLNEEEVKELRNLYFG